MPADTLPGSERVAWHRGHRGRSRVRVVLRADVALIHVRDVGPAQGSGVGNVDVAHVGETHVVGRYEDLTRPEWEPTDVVARRGHCRAADPGNQCRRIYG